MDQYNSRCALLAKESGLKIVSAAVRDIDGIIYSLPAPARHPHILNTHGGLADAEQGFLTSAGTFVDRERGLELAKAAKQIKRRCGGDEHQLYSENLW